MASIPQPHAGQRESSASNPATPPAEPWIRVILPDPSPGPHSPPATDQSSRLATQTAGPGPGSSRGAAPALPPRVLPGQGNSSGLSADSGNRVTAVLPCSRYRTALRDLAPPLAVRPAPHSPLAGRPAVGTPTQRRPITERYGLSESRKTRSAPLCQGVLCLVAGSRSPGWRVCASARQRQGEPPAGGNAASLSPAAWGQSLSGRSWVTVRHRPRCWPGRGARTGRGRSWRGSPGGSIRRAG